jgi:hypothetical protein
VTNRRNNKGNKMTKWICNSYEKKKRGEREKKTKKEKRRKRDTQTKEAHIYLRSFISTLITKTRCNIYINNLRT